MCEVPNSMNMADEPPQYYEYGITPEQYHAGLDKLWTVLGTKENGVDDVFTLCAARIKELEEEVREYSEAQPPI